MIRCENCNTEYESDTQLSFDNETGEYFCPNCGNNELSDIEVRYIPIDDEVGEWD